MSPMDYYIQLNNLMVLLDDNEKNNLLQLFSQLEGAAIDMTQDGEADEHQFAEIEEEEEEEEEAVDVEGVEVLGERKVEM